MDERNWLGDSHRVTKRSNKIKTVNTKFTMKKHIAAITITIFSYILIPITPLRADEIDALDVRNPLIVTYGSQELTLYGTISSIAKESVIGIEEKIYTLKLVTPIEVKKGEGKLENAEKEVTETEIYSQDRDIIVSIGKLEHVFVAAVGTLTRSKSQHKTYALIMEINSLTVPN